MIVTAIPYSPRELGVANLAAAYDEFFARLRPGDWGVMLDHDACFTTPTWYRQLEAAVDEHPDAGLFVARCNRLPAERSAWQMSDEHISRIEDNMRIHRRVGLAIERGGLKLRDVTTPPPVAKGPRRWPSGTSASGFFLMLSQATWARMGRKFPRGDDDGMQKVDWRIHQAVAGLGLRVWQIESLYLYHWCGKSLRRWEREAGIDADLPAS